MGQFLEHWLEHSAKPTVRPKTYRSYSQLARQHVIPGLGRHALVKLSPEHVQAFLNQQLKAGRVVAKGEKPQGLSPRSVQYLRAVLRRALNQAVKWGFVARNAATLVDPPRAKRHDVRTLTPDQARTLLTVSTNHRLEALVSVALSCGMRQGEILALLWADVTLDEGQIRVRHTLERSQGYWQLVETKSDESRRTIRLPIQLVDILKAHRRRQLEQRLAAGSHWTEHDFVFTTRTGHPYDGCNLTRDFKRMLKKADLPCMSFHALRHSCATLLLVQGVSPRVIMDLLGHSDIRLTLDTYSHVLPSLQDEAAAKMGALLWKTG